MDYKSVEPGLYIAGCGDSWAGTLEIIWVLPGKLKHIPSRPYGVSSWDGVVYEYYDFAKNKICTFNSYWESYIDDLVRLEDENIIKKARKLLDSHRDSLNANVKRDVERLELISQSIGEEPCQNP